MMVYSTTSLPNVLLVPSSPVDVRAIDNLTESRRLAVSWSEPLMTNGNIEFYDVQYRGIINTVNTVLSDFFESQTLSVGSTMALLQNLVPFSVYNISVRAYTGAGPGPFSEEISVATLEDGEYAVMCMCVCPHGLTYNNLFLFYHITCQYVTNRTPLYIIILLLYIAKKCVHCLCAHMCTHKWVSKHRCMHVCVCCSVLHAFLGVHLHFLPPAMLFCDIQCFSIHFSSICSIGTASNRHWPL